MKLKVWILSLFGLLSFSTPVFACDLCSIYSSAQASGKVGNGFYLGIAEQYTHFGTLQQDGVEVPNTLGQFLDSSITQMFLGYHVNHRVSLQLTVPFIHRSFLRPQGFAIQRGSVTGFGDLSMAAKVIAMEKFTENFSLTWDFLGGLKFPTGHSDLLKEELVEEEVEGAPESGIHGHDLTLGSGSWDGILGMNLFLRWHRFLMNADVQYSLRSRGTIDYRFANDLHWNLSVGAYLFKNHTFTLAGLGHMSGEHKGLDDLAGVPAEDTGITSIFLGPKILFTFQNHLNVELAGDIPVLQDNTAFQIVPDYRVRSAITWQF